MTNLILALRDKTQQMPEKVAYIHLDRNCNKKGDITFSELDQAARGIASYLTHNNITGPLIILFPTGIDFIKSFLGCLYAGILAVPVPVPYYNKSWKRVTAIAKDAGATNILTNKSTMTRLQQASTQLSFAFPDTQWITLDDVEKEKSELWRDPNVPATHLAFLQYTSGSTGTPRGVMISHDNLLHNIRDLSNHFQQTEKSVSVSWLPLFHDMGLIAHGLSPIVIGYRSIMIEPIEFIKRPAIWLNAISRYHGTYAGAPNFAYEHCVQKISQEEQSQMDLSTWEVAYSGAEPVRASTLEKFYSRFSNCGFRKKAFFPVYGLAEATLMVTGKQAGETFMTMNSLPASSHSKKAQFSAKNGFVGCGIAAGNQSIRIVNPETHHPMPDGQIGEIWVHGKNVAKGYWKQPQETKTVFQAKLHSDNTKTYLRTGDLGVVSKGQLYIVGRIKGILIINGENHSAEDIEYSVSLSHPELSLGGCMVFPIETDNGEKAVVACEVSRKVNDETKNEIISAICQEVFDEYAIPLYDIVFTPPSKLPRTTSGKLQRHIYRQTYLDELLTDSHHTIPHPSLEKYRTEINP